MVALLRELEKRLLNDFQRDVPVIARPFSWMAKTLDTTEAEVVACLTDLKKQGKISRFGGTCVPNTAGASTLAAVAAPHFDVERVAQIINAQAGVNHSYLRENEWNIWFVATGPDRNHVDQTLSNIGHLTGLKVLDLRLIKPFNIDLGFDLVGKDSRCWAMLKKTKRIGDLKPITAKERELLQELSSGLPLNPRPFYKLKCGLEEGDALQATEGLIEAGYVGRFGIIVRHRALGWRANAMVVWQLPPETIDEVGPQLASLPGVTLCYQRQAVPNIWPFTLYNMIHGRSRQEALAVLDEARKIPGLKDIPHQVLFSLHCFKQTGALVDIKRGGDIDKAN